MKTKTYNTKEEATPSSQLTQVQKTTATRGNPCAAVFFPDHILKSNTLQIKKSAQISQ